MPLIRQQPGQSLLEAIIAIGVILVSVVASTTLIVSTTRVGRVSQDRVEAANLAREGIEIIRSIRDTNWLERDQNIQDAGAPARTVEWDDRGPNNDGYIPFDAVQMCAGVPCASQTASLYVTQYTAAGWSLVTFTGTPTVANTESRISEQAVPGVGTLLTQNCTGVCGATKFWRVISITSDFESINIDTHGRDVPRLRLLSTAYWLDRGRLQQLTAEQHLYDWR